MDDLPGNPPYAERFQREFAVTQGWNHVKIPAAQWGTASGGRAMNVEAIRQWGLFLVSATEGFDYFCLLRCVWLRRQAAAGGLNFSTV